jgi:hypothetical protein
MNPNMTRRYWFGSVVAGLLGFDAARRAAVTAPPVVPSTAPSMVAVVANSDWTEVTTYTFDGANRLIRTERKQSRERRGRNALLR